MRIRDRSRNREPETGPLPARIESDASLEDAPLVGVRHSNSEVLHRKANRRNACARPHYNLRVRTSVRQRVRDEVVERLPQAQWIGRDAWKIERDLRFDAPPD